MKWSRGKVWNQIFISNCKPVKSPMHISQFYGKPRSSLLRVEFISGSRRILRDLEQSQLEDTINPQAKRFLDITDHI